MQNDDRIDRLERLVTDLDARVAVMEGRRPVVAATPRPPAERPVMRAAPVPRPAPASRPAMTSIAGLDRDDLEDLVGGRVLAWAGGVAVLLGIVFLFALAVSNGWIGETARVLLGAAGSFGLLGAGIWLHESKARTDAALAAVATGISGLFVTVTVAAQVYELVPQLPAVGIAIGVGMIATALAVRWESRGIAALGILGALSAPILVDVSGDGGTMLILFVALASAAGVVLWKRWDWLALLAFGVATPQWATFLSRDAGTLEELAVLVGFGGLGVAVAVGHELRIKAERLRGSSAYLLALNAIVVSLVGWVALSIEGHSLIAGLAAGLDDAGNLWLVAMALVHLAVGVAGARLARVSDDLRLLSLLIGVVLADIAFGLIVDGPALAIGWAATGVGFAALCRRAARGEYGHAPAGILAQAGLGGHLALSTLSALAVSDSGEVLGGTAALSGGGAAALAALAAGCLVSARIADENGSWKVLLDSIGLATVALLTALSLDGLQLVLAWAAEVVMLAAIARRTGDGTAAWGSVCFLALAGLHALSVEAPPVSLVTGLADPAAAVAALVAVAGCLILVATWTEEAEVATVMRAGTAIALLYLASTLVVTPFETDAAVDSTLLSAHQQGQMVLSVFWGLVGVGTIVVGLRRDVGAVRIAGLALLAVTIGKLFLFDLATLTSVYRVVAFTGLGLLLLGGGLVWQRLRPRRLTDLRETPAAVR